MRVVLQLRPQTPRLRITARDARQRSLLSTKRSCMLEIDGSIPGRERPTLSIKQVVTTPLPNARQQV